jgi:RHS repeat-associated protein
MGEKFSPDLHTGTGNFTVPLALPRGRNGFQPQLNLVYSTGTGNGSFGLGWNLSIPGVSRKTSKGVPRYEDDKDVFILSGAEDLIPIEKVATVTRYRPRTEGLFAEIRHHLDAANSYWEVLSKDGLVSFYGTAASFGKDPAAVADPSTPTRVFSWKLTRTEDPFGNRIEYEYEHDTGEDGPHYWDQVYLKQIRYVDFEEGGQLKFLVSVGFEYTERPDPFSEYRAGFEVRTRKRCTRIVVRTHAGTDLDTRSYELTYLDQRPRETVTLPLNNVSLLSLVTATGHDGDKLETLPPLEFRYTNFEPEKRDFFPLQGSELPAKSLADPASELVDLFGNGLPDYLEVNGSVRYWRNLGEGRFDSPRLMRDAPAGLALSDPGVQFIDANGDGRTDLLVTNGVTSGYFPLAFNGQWDQRSFQRYRQAPSFNLEDPEVKLVDLDGDGITDAVRSGNRLECFFNDPKEGWNNTRFVVREALEVFPDVNFSDPRVKWGNFTGDGLQTIALVYDGSIQYWPHFGYGNWGKPVRMENSPRFPYGFDPNRILIGDVDGDGMADVVYVDDTKVTLWINQSGNRWSDPVVIQGTPSVSDIDSVRLADVLGSGISGVLWTREVNGLSRDHLFFLDFTGALKPYLLHEMDNHIGALTKVEYAPSVRFYLEDQKLPATRWKTTLPFPVHVVSRVEVIDHFSGGKLTTEYRYRHGYWDGVEREFRGFGMVEQHDTESFEEFNVDGLHGPGTPFIQVDRKYFSPPTLTRTWFHQGPVGDEFGDGQELDCSGEYWTGDPPLLSHRETVNQFLKELAERRVRRDALRALRGSVLRTELYALDGSGRQDRPYTVSESSYGLVEIEPPADANRLHIFYPHETSQRTTQWERGDDPMTRFSFTRYTDQNDGDRFDPFGRPLAQTQIACPRGWRKPDDQPADPFLATRSVNAYAEPIGPQPAYIHTRTAKATSYEIMNTSGTRVADIASIRDSSPDLTLIGQTLSFYDGAAFVGLPLGQVGEFGAITRTESLVLTDKILQDAYGDQIPPYFEPTGKPNWTSDYPLEFRALLPTRAGYTFHSGSSDPADPKGYYVNANRRRYDFQTNPSGKGTGLVLETADPLFDATANPSGHRTLIEYDHFQFLPALVTDAAGLAMQAVNDYRVLQPREVTDPNGNRSIFTFSPLGLPESSSVLGKSSSEGDQNRPSVRMEYGFRAFDDSSPEDRQPIFVRTIRQIHHDTEMELPLPERDETITTVEYSDGFGRLLQTRTQGEDIRFGDEHFGGGESVLPVKQSDGAGGDVAGRRNTDPQNPNVVVSGWQFYDNKGQVVEKYEPFFSEGWDYVQPAESKLGQKVVMFYDPRGRVIRTLNPDGSEQRVILGVPGTVAAPDLTRPDNFAPTPWEAYTYDANDNAGRTHPMEASGYRHHWDTPASILIDPLGRTIKAVVRNCDAPPNPDGLLPPIEELVTQTTYDIRGNVLAIVDALGRMAFQHTYDFANETLRTESIDAGVRKTVLDAAGGTTEERDSKGALTLHGADNLNRPLRLWARDGAGQKLTLRERMEYGDAGDPSQSAAEREINRAQNRLGKLSRSFDEAGLLSFETYDFKGNLLDKTRRVVSDAAILAVFSPPPAGWKVDAYRVDWTSTTAVPLDGMSFTSTVSYDALNRTKLMTYPQDVENQRRELRPRYNLAGALESVALDADIFVERIAYNAKGQRALIAYGNGIMTRYAYDPQTFRLLHLRTEPYNKPSELLYRHTGDPQQELAYEFDLVGNILRIFERTPGCGIPNTSQGTDALDRDFLYDAIYRLLSATGRECDLPPHIPWDDAPRCTDITKTRRYTEQYSYDFAGNIEQLKHLANGAGPNRMFGLVPGNNRLLNVTVGTTAFRYEYDSNGNMIAETSSRHFEWDSADQMRVYRTQTLGSEPSVYAHYLYDSDGQRVKKLVRKQGGQVELTVYIDGIFEYQTVARAGAAVQNNTLHVMDSQSRVAQVRVGTVFATDTTPAIKYHLGDHLGSSNVVLDGKGKPINREEYTPYGDTSFGSFARKRYRFTGEERDGESGLSFHGARYCAPWLGRWITCDPAGPLDGPNLYGYASCNPMRLIDPTGMGSEEGAPALPDVTSVPTGDSSGVASGASLFANTQEKADDFTGPDGPTGLLSETVTVTAKPKPPPSNLEPAVPPMQVPYTFAPSKYFVLPPTQFVDTGSEVGNYALAALASASNFVNAILNVRIATERVIAERVRDKLKAAAGASDTDFAAAEVYLAVEGVSFNAALSESSQGFGAWVGSGLARRQLNGVVRAPAYAFVGGGGVGGGRVSLPATHDHHIFVQQRRADFLKLGIDVDEYTITISAKKHIELHSGGDYNWEWEEFFHGEGARPSYEGAFEFALDLLYQYGIRIGKNNLAHRYRK